MTDSEFLMWVRDRLVNVYNESENVDFVIKLEILAGQLKYKDEGIRNQQKRIEELREEVKILKTAKKRLIQNNRNLVAELADAENKAFEKSWEDGGYQNGL